MSTTPHNLAINGEWPINLYLQIFGIDAEHATDRDAHEIESGIMTALDTLTLKEKDILIQRYQNHLSLSKVGDIYELTRTRIGQIESRALRKMRHPSRVKYMLPKVEEPPKDEPNNTEEWDKESIGEMKIEELDLSVRSFNCLRRASIYTVADTIRLFKDGSILRVRNLGRRSADEIYYKLTMLGIPASELKYEDPKHPDESPEEKEARLAEERRKLEEEKEARARQKKEEMMFADILWAEMWRLHAEIVEKGCDALGTLFQGPILNEMQTIISNLRPDERVVSILVRTEVIDPDKGSPYSDLLRVEGQERLNRVGFHALRNKYGVSNWERFQYRASKNPIVENPPNAKTHDVLDEKMFIRELDVKPEIKSILYRAGFITVNDLGAAYQRDLLIPELKRMWNMEYYRMILEEADIKSFETFYRIVTAELIKLGYRKVK